jgi:hypothetical protein
MNSITVRAEGQQIRYTRDVIYVLLVEKNTLSLFFVPDFIRVRQMMIALML